MAVMGRMALPKRIISYRFTFCNNNGTNVGRKGRGGVIAECGGLSFRCLHIGDIVNNVLKEWGGTYCNLCYVIYVSIRTDECSVYKSAHRIQAIEC